MPTSSTPRPKTPTGAKPGRPAGASSAINRLRVQAVMRAEIKPLDAMLDILAHRWGALMDARKELRDVIDAPRPTRTLIARTKRNVFDHEERTLHAAERVAPYIHPKLQAVTVKGAPEAPLGFALVPADTLKSLVRGTET